MKAVPVLCFAAMAGSGWFATSLGPQVDVPRDPAGLEANETHASASLLGQFRTNLSSWLWLRTDLYLHNGVEMRQLTDDEAKAGVEGEAAAEGHELHDESHSTTAVPPKERDFRGIFGDIERTVATTQDMHAHKHREPAEAMPLFRLMTWADPEFTQGWLVGGMVLAQEKPGGSAAAIAYLKEGLESNPRSMPILVDLGRLYARQLGDVKNAVTYFNRAIDSAPVGMLEEEQAETLLEAYRWSALCYRELGDATRLASVAREGLSKFRGDVILARTLYPVPPVLTLPGEKEYLEWKLRTDGTNKRLEE